MGSSKKQDINPNDYLRDILNRLPSYPISKIKELLPGNWKPITPAQN
ncbi:MAG: transposase domain-containing protein [Chitinophagaceae bacterium]